MGSIRVLEKNEGFDLREIDEEAAAIILISCFERDDSQQKISRVSFGLI